MNNFSFSCYQLSNLPVGMLKWRHPDKPQFRKRSECLQSGCCTWHPALWRSDSICPSHPLVHWLAARLSPASWSRGPPGSPGLPSSSCCFRGFPGVWPACPGLHAGRLASSPRETWPLPALPQPSSAVPFWVRQPSQLCEFKNKHYLVNIHYQFFNFWL